MQKINYNNCITNLSNSILKYYNAETFHNSLELIDRELEFNKPKNVVLILLDGLGSKILEEHLNEEDFLYKYGRESIFSVLPTTTAAATTSVMSGLNPCEHGWIGWDVYFNDINKIVTLFTNKIKDSEQFAEEYNVAREKMPYKDFCELIKEKNSDVNAVKLFPFGNDKYASFEEAMQKVEKLCNNGEKNFIYVYNDNPDKIMHQTGTISDETHKTIKELNYNIEKLSSKIQNTTIIVIADHGHIDSEPIYLTDYPQILDTLRMDISVESRACAFFVKKDKIKQFEELFFQNFSKYFTLYKKSEVIKENMLGVGTENKYFQDAIGDYMAFGISNKYFRSNKECKKFVSQHAGITNDEVLIPLIIKNM